MAQTFLDRIDPGLVKLDLYVDRPRVSPDQVPGEARLENPKRETAQTISEEQFLREAERCFSCGSCFGCQYCWMYCNAAGFTAIENAKPGDYFALDLSVCEGCGKCVDVCPTGYLSVRAVT
jgi:formate hydrogenlyase subunit 6/NADH:ubiquinone oxidoreductase subunit I